MHLCQNNLIALFRIKLFFFFFDFNSRFSSVLGNVFLARKKLQNLTNKFPSYTVKQ